MSGVPGRVDRRRGGNDIGTGLGADGRLPQFEPGAVVDHGLQPGVDELLGFGIIQELWHRFVQVNTLTLKNMLNW